MRTPAALGKDHHTPDTPQDCFQPVLRLCREVRMGSKPRHWQPKSNLQQPRLRAITTVSRPCVLLWQIQSWLVPQGVSGGETDPWRPRAQPKRPSFTGNGIYHEASIADLDVTMPSPCRYSYSAQRLQLTWCISYVVYSFRGEVHERMWCDPISGNISTAKNSSTMFLFGSTSTRTSAARLKTRNNPRHSG